MATLVRMEGEKRSASAEPPSTATPPPAADLPPAAPSLPPEPGSLAPVGESVGVGVVTGGSGGPGTPSGLFLEDCERLSEAGKSTCSSSTCQPFGSPHPSEGDEPQFDADGKRIHVKVRLPCPACQKGVGKGIRSWQKRRGTMGGGGSEGGRSGLGAYPMSERQQLALLKQIEEATSPSSTPAPGTVAGPGTPAPSAASTPASAGPGTGSKRGKVARVHRRNERGETPLHIAARKGDAKTVRSLLREGADVNCVDYAGWTPLHESCNHGWPKTAEVHQRQPLL